MNKSSILRLFFLLFYLNYTYSAKIFQLDEKYPQYKSEIEVCGNIRDVIKRNSARFLKILVRNTNSEIVFLNDDALRMTARAKSKLDVLASRVQTRWGGKKVKVLKAWTDVVVPNSISLHYEGRALQLQVSDNDRSKLGELAGLAAEAGFDWVHYTRNNYVHASVVRDVCQTSVDLAFILDSSGSVGGENFDKMKKFVKDVIDFFNVGIDGTHVAVVKYSHWSNIEFFFNKYYTKSSLKEGVHYIRFISGGTNTGNAISLTRTQVFNTANGMRPDKAVPKVAVLMTDGRSHDNPRQEAIYLKNAGVNVFCVGLGFHINHQELKDIASDPDKDHVFYLSSFTALSSWVDKLSAVSCDEGASVSACDDTISKVADGSFLYFRTEFVSVTGGISVEVQDAKGISHLYVSLKSKNPGPMDPASLKNENNASPRSLRLKFPTQNSKQLVFVAVQGQQHANEFKLSMWDTLFSSDTFTARPKEEQNSGLKVMQVTSTAYYSVRYSFAETSNTDGMFRIDSSSGSIFTTGKLDRETKYRYDLTVIAQDVANACHKGRTIVTVLVQDINDHKPKFPGNKYAYVNENLPRGTWVAKVTATDEDPTAVLTYSLVNDFGKFTIDSNTGVVLTTDELDYEQKSRYDIQVQVTDGANTARTYLYVTVNDINEPPYFQDACVSSGLCRYTVKENDTSLVNTQIAKLNAVDPDKGTITYKLRILDSQDKAFSVDSSGSIKLLKILDRETKSSYRLVVTASDNGRPVLSREAPVEIIVSDINDNAPVFPFDKYTGSVYENSYIGFQVIQVLAQDADDEANSKIAYSLHSANTDSFSINPSTGIIRTRKRFDRETKEKYQLTVRAVDGGGLYGEASVTIDILDDNDHAPVCSQNTYNENVREDANRGDRIGKVTATDKDTGINADLRYTILSGNIDNTFNMDTKTGQVTLQTSLDHERRTSYSLSIMVSDRGSPALSTTCRMDVMVTDINDNNPIFQSRGYQATVKENSVKGTTVVKLSATDIDSGSNGEVRYYITDGNGRGTFTIDQNTGWISVSNPPSYNTQSQYDLTVEARDQGQPIRKDSIHAIITIEDVNDNAPVFNPSSYTAQVREDVGKGVSVTKVTATDDDTGPLGRVMFSIVGGNYGNAFGIDTTSGTITVASYLDRETTPSYTLTIEARDGGVPSLSSRCQATITLIDLNDNSPVFGGPYTFHIAENKDPSTLVGTVTATDRDTGSNGRVTYTGSTSEFKVDSNTGKITTLKKLDYEKQTMYSLTITAKDHGSQPRQATTVVKVMVDDLNDNPPRFPHDMYNCSVAENLEKNAGVCYVTAVDLDSGENARLYYSLTGGDSKFTINTATGEITTTQPLDREKIGSYHLVVTAKNGPSFLRSAGFSDSVDVYVSIQDENDNQPRFHGAPFKFNVSEGASVGTNFGKVSASDADIGPNGKLTFTIVTGNIGSVFKIDPDTGVLTVQKTLDRETIPNYALTIDAKDSGTPTPQSSRTVVMVTVDDVNDNAPIFDRSKYYGEIREDASIDSSVLQVRAYDRDSGSNGRLTYSLSGQGSSNFTIDTTGFIKSATPLDYEKTSSYIMTVTARDSGNPSKSASAQVNISIVNVNDNVPSFESQAQVTYVSEDVAIGTRVVKMNATDSDGNKLTFSITKGNTHGSFLIGSDDGVISVAKRLDRETTADYTLTVEARDSGGNAVSNNATIRVLDVNDNKPVFKQSPYRVVVVENNPRDTVLTTVQATDSDQGKNAEISYYLTKGDQSKFQVNPKTGVLSARVGLDREDKASYELEITAKDHGTPSQSSVTKVTVDVRDVNDNTPQFPKSSYSVTVVENTAVNSVVLRLHATDPDDGSNGRVSYAIISGSTNNAFKIDVSTGELAVAASIDRETIASYNLVIGASDGGSSSRSSSTNVVITIADENDNAPKYTNPNNVFTVKENVPKGTPVGSVMATDADVGNNGIIQFSIIAGPTALFAIDSSNGAITVAGPIDRETKQVHQLTIRASDRGSPVMFTDKVFQVNVEDDNDNPPMFTKPIYRVSIAEDAAINSVVMKVNSTDADVGQNAQVRYQIVSGNTGDAFKIDSQSGAIATKSSLDYETLTAYNLNVSATDGKYTTYASVLIDVVNINDNSPKFTQKSYRNSIKENSALLSRVLPVSANDVDSFGGLVYTLNSSYPFSKRFNMDPSSGQISTAERLDREDKDTYTFQVIVKDRGIPQRSDVAMVTIDVTDVNDNAPVFTGSKFSFNVLENVTIGTQVFQIQATDMDLGNNAKISYRLANGSPFTIDESSGMIRTTAELDRETTSSYTLTCTAADHGNPSLSKQTAIHVTVLDVNDNKPRFEKNEYRDIVREDEAIGAVVSEVLAVDDDLHKAGKVIYSIASGNEDGMFTIGNTTGIISLLKSLDREVKDKYQLTITAADLGTPPLSSSAKVYLTVLDVNDNTPQFNTTSLRGGVKENEPAGTYVMRLDATDKDIGLNAQLVFDLLTTEYHSTFTLNQTTGIITTLKKLDREAQSSYNLKVRVSDMGRPKLTSSADVTIDVIDVDDNCPSFHPSVYNVSIVENQKRGSHIAFVSATDPDKVANKIIEYKIKSGMPGGEFKINATTGEITVDNNVDRETSAMFKLTVRAGQAKCDEMDKNDTDTEGGGSETLSSASAIVYIYVQDVNDNAPKFSKSFYEYNFKDIKTTELFTISATDDDLGLGGEVEYGLAGLTEVYGDRHLLVSARDKGTPSMESKVTVVVKTSLSCEAMVFDVSKGGKISTKTLCMFDVKPDSSIVNSGLPHQMFCSAKGNTNPSYRWMLNGRFVSSWSPNSTYTINKLSQDDEGSYSCLARSDAGVIQSEPATLTVYDVPEVLAHPENASVAIRGTTTLHCLAKGDPDPKYQWYKNGELLPPSGGIESTNDPHLVLKEAIPQDEAWYRCLVTNAAKRDGVWTNAAFLAVYEQKALVKLEITVSKPHPTRRCHMFDMKNFKALLNKVLEGRTTFTNITAPGVCKPDPCGDCSNGGSCEKQPNGDYACICPQGWTGRRCTEDVDECARVPCLHGTCLNKEGTYECACAKNYTGKNCNLRTDACANMPCNESMCVLSEMGNNGYQCVDASQQMEMFYKTKIDKSNRFDIEKEIEGLLKSAPKKNPDTQSKRRRREAQSQDYGLCSVRITSFDKNYAKFVLLCPLSVKVDINDATQFVCGMVLGSGTAKHCGHNSVLTTMLPPTTYPPLQPSIINILLFARDANNKDMEGDKVVSLLESSDFKHQMEKQGMEFVAAKRVQGNTSSQQAEKKANVGLIVGMVFLAIALVAGVSIGLAYLYHQRRKGHQSFVNVEDRAVIGRADSRKHMLQRNVSTKDIARSEKKFINQAFTDSVYDDGEDDQFMVEVNLPAKKTPTSKAVKTLYEAPYYYDKIAPIEAEMLLDDKVPVGTFLLRKGVQSGEYVLSVKSPEGGPSHRHLVVKHTNRDNFEVQFGSMPLSLEFDSANDIIEHFQATPIEFGADVPDVKLGDPCNKAVVA